MSGLQGRGTLEDGRTRGWFYCDNALFSLQISKHAKLVYLYLCRCAGNGETCFPSFADISAKTDCSHGVVGEALRELEKAELITRKPRRTKTGRHTSTIYTLLRLRPADTVTVVHGQPAETVRVQPADTKKKHSEPEEDENAAPEGAAFVPPHLERVSERRSEERGRPGPAAASQGNSSRASLVPSRPGHPAVVRYCERWKAHHGKAATMNPKRIGILTQIYKRLEADPDVEPTSEYGRLLDALFVSRDPFIINNAQSPEVFTLRFDALRSTRGVGAPRRSSVIPNQDITEVRECVL